MRKRVPPDVEHGSPIIDVTRHRSLSPTTRLLVCVNAGGRCERLGCRRFLFEHPLTLTPGNFAEVAHIVAFKEDGPRGRSGPRPSNIDSLDNLMLLCPPCHKLVDDHPAEYPRELLQRYKADHEERIRIVTDLGPDVRTLVLNFKAPVRGQPVDIPPFDVARAVYPRYPVDKKGHLIDLNVLKGVSGQAFFESAKQIVDRKIAELYAQGAPAYETRHVSLFALAPIPLLVYLGGRLSNKIPLDLFQRHRDTQDWTWKTDGPAVDFEYVRLRQGTDPARVALALPLNGTIDHQRLPGDIDGTFSLYEFRLRGMEPGLHFLRRRDDLTSFGLVYREFLGMLGAKHLKARELHMFPAVPAPIAILCGFERLPQVQPHLVVYNNDGPDQGFTKSLTVDDHPCP
jgi:hypothetical protein